MVNTYYVSRGTEVTLAQVESVQRSGQLKSEEREEERHPRSNWTQTSLIPRIKKTHCWLGSGSILLSLAKFSIMVSCSRVRPAEVGVPMLGVPTASAVGVGRGVGVAGGRAAVLAGELLNAFWKKEKKIFISKRTNAHYTLNISIYWWDNKMYRIRNTKTLLGRKCMSPTIKWQI